MTYIGRHRKGQVIQRRRFEGDSDFIPGQECWWAQCHMCGSQTSGSYPVSLVAHDCPTTWWVDGQSHGNKPAQLKEVAR